MATSQSEMDEILDEIDRLVDTWEDDSRQWEDFAHIMIWMHEEFQEMRCQQK